jgi:hypothetical protein
MRIFNRSHILWFIFVMLASVAACWLYLGNFYPDRLPAGARLPAGLTQKPSGHHSVGGTPLGLAFGAIALAIFIFATLFGVRKKVPLWRIGSVQRWMRAHIWLTLLTIPLVLFHSGFRLGGPMTALLMVLYAVVMVSGVYGLILQHQIPRIMKERLPTETVFEQIPHLRAQLCAAAEEMRQSLIAEQGKKLPSMATLAVARPAGAPVAFVTEASVPETAENNVPDPESKASLLDFLDRQALPYLRTRRIAKGGLGNGRFSDDAFRFVRLHVTAPYRRLIDELQGWCDERRMLDWQTKLHRWLHGWLFVHVPFSFLLLILTMWHAFVTLFYY